MVADKPMNIFTFFQMFKLFWHVTKEDNKKRRKWRPLSRERPVEEGIFNLFSINAFDTFQ